MKTSRPLFGLAAAIVVAYVVARVAGLAEHTSAVAGMPIAQSSWVLGPLHVVLHLAAVIVAPVLALAGAFETAFVRVRRR